MGSVRFRGARESRRRVHGNAYALGRRGDNLEIAGDKRAHACGMVADECIQILGRGIPFGGDDGRRFSFARPDNGKFRRHLDTEHGGVAIGREVGEREPPGGKQQVSRLLVDGGQAHALYRAVLFIGERAGIDECKSHFGADQRRLRERDAENQGILVIASEGHRLAFSRRHFRDAEVGVQLDLDVARGFAGLELNFGAGGDPLADRVESGGQIVMNGAVRSRVRRLSSSGDGAEKKQGQEYGGLAESNYAQGVHPM